MMRWGGAACAVSIADVSPASSDEIVLYSPVGRGVADVSWKSTSLLVPLTSPPHAAPVKIVATIAFCQIRRIGTSPSMMFPRLRPADRPRNQRSAHHDVQPADGKRT